MLLIRGRGGRNGKGKESSREDLDTDVDNRKNRSGDTYPACIRSFVTRSKGPTRRDKIIEEEGGDKIHHRVSAPLLETTLFFFFSIFVDF